MRTPNGCLRNNDRNQTAAQFNELDLYSLLAYACRLFNIRLLQDQWNSSMALSIKLIFRRKTDG
jgi:hypothetical protein